MEPMATFEQKIILRALGESPGALSTLTETEANVRIADLRTRRERRGFGEDNGAAGSPEDPIGADQIEGEYTDGDNEQEGDDDAASFASETLQEMEDAGLDQQEQKATLVSAIQRLRDYTDGGSEQQGEGSAEGEDEGEEEEEQERQRQARREITQAQQENMERVRQKMKQQQRQGSGLSQLGKPQAPKLNKQTLRDAIERALDDSDTLKDRVFRVIWENREQLSDVLEVPEQISEAVGDINRRFDAAVQQVRDELGLVLTIEDVNREPVVLEGAHPTFAEFYQVEVVDRENAYLEGPSGTGKTTAARMLADALGLPFFMISGSPFISKVDVFGYQDGAGAIQDTPFTLAWTQGGVMLADEFDRWHEQTAAMINAAAENRIVALPGRGMVEAHENFYLVGAGNTSMTGATRAYNDARGQGQATRKRWSPIPWDYDRSIEQTMAGFDPFGWGDFVRSCREAAKAMDYDEMVLTSHDIRRGAKMLRRGVPWPEVELRTIFWGVDEDQLTTVKTRAGFDVSYRGAISYAQYQELVAESFESETEEREEAVA